MKQRINGRKVINWHSPFRGHHKSQRFLRLKEAPLNEDLEYSLKPQSERDFHSDYCRCNWCDYYSPRHWEGSDLEELQLRIIRFLEKHSRPTLGDLPGAEQLRKLLEQTEEVLPPARPEGQGPEPSQLLELFSQAKTLWKHLGRYSEQNNFGLSPAGIEAFARLIRPLSGVELENLINLILLKNFWVRPVESWQDNAETPRQRLQSLIRHLLVKYEVPTFFYHAWWQWEVEPTAPWFIWFISLAQGLSLKKVARVFNWDLPAKLPHLLLQAEGIGSFDKALEWAEMQRLEVSEIELNRIKFYNSNPLNPVLAFPREGQVSGEYAQLQYFRDTLLWLRKHREELNLLGRSELWDIRDWGMHMFTESMRWGEGAFSWKGRSVARVLEAARFYQRIRSSLFQRNYSWKPRGLDWSFQDENAREWKFTELCSSEELGEEGRAMRHCVAGYAGSCYMRHTTIFSVTCGGERKLTVELDPNSRKPRQVRGACNRLPLGYEKMAVEAWLIHLQGALSCSA